MKLSVWFRVSVALAFVLLVTISAIEAWSCFYVRPSRPAFSIDGNTFSEPILLVTNLLFPAGICICLACAWTLYKPAKRGSFPQGSIAVVAGCSAVFVGQCVLAISLLNRYLGWRFTWEQVWWLASAARSLDVVARIVRDWT